MYDLHQIVAKLNCHKPGIEKLCSAVVLASLDRAIQDEQESGNGVSALLRWLNSKDGHQVLRCAGIEPSVPALNGMVNFVQRWSADKHNTNTQEQETGYALRPFGPPSTA